MNITQEQEGMKQLHIEDLPTVDARESKVTLEYLIGKLSYINSPESEVTDYGQTEIFLCLANEIARLKKEIEELRK